MATLRSTNLSRRAFLSAIGIGGAVTLLAACAPAQQPSPGVTVAPPTTPPQQPTSVPVSVNPTQAPAAPPTSSPTAEWDKLVAAARQEKTLTIATYAGAGFRKTMEAFRDAFPGIEVEHSQFQSASRDFVPRLLAENAAGLYAWDVAHMPPHEMLASVRKAGGIDPIRPALIVP